MDSGWGRCGAYGPAMGQFAILGQLACTPGKSQKEHQVDYCSVVMQTYVCELLCYYGIYPLRISRVRRGHHRQVIYPWLCYSSMISIPSLLSLSLVTVEVPMHSAVGVICLRMILKTHYHIPGDILLRSESNPVIYFNSMAHARSKPTPRIPYSHPEWNIRFLPLKLYKAPSTFLAL